MSPLYAPLYATWRLVASARPGATFAPAPVVLPSAPEGPGAERHPVSRNKVAVNPRNNGKIMGKCRKLTGKITEPKWWMEKNHVWLLGILGWSWMYSLLRPPVIDRQVVKLEIWYHRLNVLDSHIFCFFFLWVLLSLSLSIYMILN